MRYLNLLLALLMLSAFVLTGCDKILSRQQPSNINQSTNAINTPTPQTTLEEAKRISLEDAKAAYDKGNVVFVDMRDADSFTQEHIKGAINIPLPEFEKRYQEIPTGKQIIAYCS